MSWLAIRAILGRALSALSKLNLWQLLLIASLIFGAIQTVRVKAEQRHSAKVEGQISRMNAALQAEREAVRQKNAQLADISALLRKANDEENRRIAGDAGALRVSGPGKAACRPVAPAAPSGRIAAPAKPDAPGPALPPDDLAGVSWNWLVQRGQEHDQLRAEVQSWHDWYDQLVKNWPKK